MPGGWGANYNGGAAKQQTPAKGGWGANYNAPVAPHVVPPTPKPSGGGGFWHEILHNPVTHAVGQTVTDLKNVAVYAPAGIYALGKAGAHDVNKAGRAIPGANTDLTGGLFGKPVSSEGRYQLPAVAKQMGEQIKTDLSHPLRHPGYTLLDVLPGVNAAGKAAEVGALVKAGDLGEAGRALVTKRVPPARVIEAKGVTARLGNYSQSPSFRVAQQTIDRLRARFPEASIPGVKSQVQRVGDAAAKNRAVESKILNAPFTQLRAAGKGIKWDSPKGVAMRAVAEGTPLEARIAAHQADLKDVALTATARRAITRQIRIAEQAKQYVGTVAGKLAITDPQLAKLYEQTKAAALLEDKRLVEGRMMSAPEAAINKPRDLIAPESAHQPQFHVGYDRRNKPFAINKPPGVGNRDTIGIPRKPSRLSHALTGSNFRQGAFRNDVPSLVADNAIESERYLAAVRARNHFLQVAHDTPEAIQPGHAVAIRTDELGAKPMANEVKDFLDQQRQIRQTADHTFNPLGVQYEDLRQRMFPQIDPADFERYRGQVKWVDDRLLGGLNKPGPLASLMQHPAAARTLGIADAINNAQKFAILYLKPAYAVPNIVGNAFLNLVQQGWASPANLTRSARLAAKIGAGDAAVIRDLMGEGIGSSLESAGRRGIIGTATDLAARKVFEPIVDTPFRLASFLYEARRELGLHGTMSSADWKRVSGLLHDEHMRPQLLDVVHRANRAIIDYGDLTPVEQSIIRRVVFFYPWLKGSTKYAGRFLAENPMQAGALGQIGQQGQNESLAGLGPLPSWAEGNFKVGGSDQFPLIVNPTSAGILNQPGQLAETANQFFSSGNPAAAYTLANNLTPVLSAALATLSGKDPFTNKNVPRNAATFLHQLGVTGNPSEMGIPLATLVARLTQNQQGRTFPTTHTQAVLQYLLGGVAPKTANREKLNAAYQSEKKPLRP